MYKLLIVESPKKARTIQKYLGKEYRVLSSRGHIKDLPIKELGVEPKNKFKMKIVPMKGKEEVIKYLKKAIDCASEVYLATDPDREGEAIAFHLKGLVKNKPVKRVLFRSITKEVVKKSLENPTTLNKAQYEAQKTRRILDRLVGYKISPLICNALNQKVSAGRVQSVALRLVIEREQEIENFVPDNWFNIKAKLEKDKGFFSNYFGDDTKKRKVLEDKEVAEKILEDIKNSPFILSDKQVKDTYRKPSPPFTTSKLQQEAARKLKFSTKQTMQVAQRLYEGIEITGRGTIGLITYMRTDSTRTDEGALKEVRDYILKEYGEKYLEPKTILYGKKAKNAQDAHEAIRPTVMLSPEEIKEDLDPEAFSLYELIWNKFISSQMAKSKYEQTTMFFENNSHFFKTTGSVLIFDGFKKVFEDGKDEKRLKKGQEDEAETGLPIVNIGESLKSSKNVLEAKQSSPPNRFKEETLVAMMEKRGIGRPSTYASIIYNIIGRAYVEKRKNEFHSTELGRKVLKLLLENFSEQFAISYTSKIEEKLDLIDSGEKKWLEVLEEFWASLDSFLTEARKKEIFKYKNTKQEKTGIKCHKCDGEYVVINYSKSPFLSCSNYPKCRSTQSFKKVKSGYKIVDRNKYHPKPCPKCKSKLVLKKGKFGEFWGCTNYPDCKFIRKKGIGPCPKCDGGEIIKRNSINGEFWGCSSFPKCKNTMSQKPTKKQLEELKAKAKLKKS